MEMVILQKRKTGETFIWRFDGNYEEVIQSISRVANNPKSSLTWTDASGLALEIRRLARLRKHRGMLEERGLGC